MKTPKVLFTIGIIGCVLFLIGFQGEPTTLVDWAFMIVGVALLIISYLKISPSL